MTTRKEDQERIDREDRALYKAIRAFIDKNPGMTIERACEEEFKIPWPRYYTVRKKHLAYMKQKKKAKTAPKAARKKASNRESQELGEESAKKPGPTMTTISYPSETAGDTPVTPELVPFTLNGNDLGLLFVTRARNFGAIMDHILHRL